MKFFDLEMDNCLAVLAISWVNPHNGKCKEKKFSIGNTESSCGMDNTIYTNSTAPECRKVK